MNSERLSDFLKVTELDQRIYTSDSVQFSCSVMSDSLWPHGLQHTRLPCPSPTLWACTNSRPLSWWCHPTISSSVISFSSCISIFSSIRVFSNESAHLIRWPNYWSFSFSVSPPIEYSGLIFRINWLGLLAVQGTQESSPTPQFKNLNSSVLSFLYSPTLTSIESVMPSNHFILLSPFPPAPNPSQHQSLFRWVNTLHEVAKVLEFQL